MKRFGALVAVILAVLLSASSGRQFACRVSVFLAGSGGMYARECGECRSLWPDENQYRRCPQCEVSTKYVAKRSMTPRVANARMAAIRFEREYQERERARVARGEPSPEDRGREDAARDLAEIQALEAHLSNDAAVNVERHGSG